MSIERRRFLTFLGAGCTLLAGCAGNAPTRSLRGYGVPAIDLHTHWFPAEWLHLIEREGKANGAQFQRVSEREVIVTVKGIRMSVRSEHVELAVRLKEMDAARVDIQALSLTSPMVYWAPPAFGLKLAQVYNDGLAAAHRQYPNRFLGLATLPMQAPDLAVQEIERAAKLPGIRGVYMATQVNGRNLDDKSLWPVYARCEALGLPLLLHPIDPVGAERMRGYYLRNFLGNPYDTGIAAASLVFGGVMDAYPQLDVVLPHAGGAFPALIGRMDHGTTVRPETRHMTRPPSTYLRRFHYDTITHSTAILADLVRQVGADRVVLGSDHPADMSYERPVDAVERTASLSGAERELILGGNAARLLKIASAAPAWPTGGT